MFNTMIPVVIGAVVTLVVTAILLPKEQMKIAGKGILVYALILLLVFGALGFAGLPMPELKLGQTPRVQSPAPTPVVEEVVEEVPFVEESVKEEIESSEAEEDQGAEISEESEEETSVESEEEPAEEEVSEDSEEEIAESEETEETENSEESEDSEEIEEEENSSSEQDGWRPPPWER